MKNTIDNAERKSGFPSWLIAPLVLILIVFYWPFLSGSVTYFFRDIPHYIEPFSRFTGLSMRYGKLPLWNPFCYCGMPQIAVTIQSIVYPPIWLFSLMSFGQAMAANLIVHQVLAFIGGFLLITSFGWGFLPALLAGLTLSLCGYMFSLSCNFSLIISASWCPITLWAFIELCKQQTVRRTLIAAVCFTGLIFAGHFELGIIECALLASLFAWLAWRSFYVEGTKDLKPISWSVRALVLGTLLAMPLLLPAVEWLSLSRRSSGLTAEESFLLSANWYDLLCLILPQPLGDLQERWAHFRPLIMHGSMVTYLPAAFVGPVIFTCATWALSDKTWKARALTASLLILSVFIALGGNTPVAPFLMATIPALTVMRFPIKLLFFCVWAIAVMAARGIRAYEEGACSVWASFAFWMIFAIAGGLLFAGVHWGDTFASGMKPSGLNLLHESYIPIGTAAMIAGGIGVATNMVAWIGHLTNKRKIAIYVIGAGAVSTMLLYAFAFCHHGAPADFFKQPSLADTEITKLRRQEGKGINSRVMGLYLERFSPPLDYLGTDPKQATISLFQYSRELLRPNTNIDFAQLSPFGFEGTPTGEYYNFWMNCYLTSSQTLGADPSKSTDIPLARICQTTAAAYALTQIYRFDDNSQAVPVPALDKNLFHLAYENDRMNLRIYTVHNSVPRAYFTSNFKFVDSHDKVIEQMFNPASSGFNPALVTLVEGTGAQGQSSSSNIVAQFLDNEFDTVTLSVKAPQSGLVVLADQYYPGWVADIDGAPSPILVANGFMRAVAVSPGKHVIHFNYRPESLQAGLVLFGLAVVWLAFLFYSNRRKRSPSKSDAPPTESP